MRSCHGGYYWLRHWPRVSLLLATLTLSHLPQAMAQDASRSAYFAAIIAEKGLGDMSAAASRYAAVIRRADRDRAQASLALRARQRLLWLGAGDSIPPAPPTSELLPFRVLGAQRKTGQEPRWVRVQPARRVSTVAPPSLRRHLMRWARSRRSDSGDAPPPQGWRLLDRLDQVTRDVRRRHGATGLLEYVDAVRQARAQRPDAATTAYLSGLITEREGHLARAFFCYERALSTWALSPPLRRRIIIHQQHCRDLLAW